ncbi:Copper(I)-binding protein [Amycolatopsis rubida]|uniref:Copper(I)-binding protein n=1 Tax=Amycolatopsis rubida TaxID=112413 RepID=A0A1I5GI62_9PSEU|nr:Copper(I)-binding protein [Amycolatopsis rubida]
MKGKDSDVRLQNRRVLGAGVSALGAALVLAGCGAGQITQTDTQQPAVNGTYAQVKTIVLRDAAVQYPAQGPGYAAGSSAPLTLTVINQGQKDDKLVSVTSEGASGPAQISGDSAIVAGHSLVIGPADAVEQGAPPQAESANSTPASETDQAPSSAPASSANSAPGSASNAPQAGENGGAASQLGTGKVVLPGLKQPLWPGATIKVTFTFQNAGPIVVELPVAAPAHAGS